MKRLILVALLITLSSTLVFGETTRKFNLVLNGGMSFKVKESKDILSDTKSYIADIAYMQKVTDYIGFTVLGGMNARNMNDDAKYAGISYTKKIDYSTTYAGGGLTLFFPLTYVDLYATAGATYNINKIKMTSDYDETFNKTKSTWGLLLNTGFLYYYGNISLGAKYQYQYNEYPIKVNSKTTTYDLTSHAFMASIGLSF